MRLALTERFQRDVRDLSDEQRAAVFEVMLALPGALGSPHQHVGLGLRKLHPSGIWEARLGLGLRLVFTIESDTAALMRVGTHDEIRRYLRSR
jgi:mRNA-degrading endonuclease YafQ of YafQ-DinJ toxin-antitoxin module